MTTYARHSQLTAMKRRNRLKMALFLLGIALYPSNTVSGQEIERAIRDQFVFYPGFRSCNPAEVKGFGLGKQPLEVMLAQVIVESRSEKMISAVKLSWKVYPEDEGLQIVTRGCAPPSVPKPLLSGGTDFIDVQALPPKETTIIGTDPLPVLQPGARTIYVPSPFMMVDDVKLVVENKKAEGRKYLVVLFVSEIRFGDDTKWVMAPVGSPDP